METPATAYQFCARTRKAVRARREWSSRGGDQVAEPQQRLAVAVAPVGGGCEDLPGLWYRFMVGTPGVLWLDA
jgi:hypothetical protein